MNILANSVKSIWSQIKAQPQFAVFSLILLGILLLNSIHGSYPDEFDNIAGGRLILSGQLPYTGFFTHHAPFAYFLAAVLNLFSGVSFVSFRLVYAVFLWLLMLGSTTYFYRRVDKSLGKLSAAVWMLVSISSIYVWSHMLLADALAAHLLIVPYLLLAWTIWHNLQLSLRQITAIASILFLTFLTSFTYLYSVAIAYLVMSLWIIRFELGTDGIRNNFLTKATAGCLLAPLLFLTYLTVTSSWGDFLYQGIQFNTNYYIYLPDDVTTSNPVRMAIVFFMEFVQNFRMILAQIPELNLFHPFAITIALAHAALWLFSGVKQRWWLVFLSLGMVAFSTARSNPLNTGETDYQANVYQFLGIANAVLVIHLTHKELLEKKWNPDKLISGCLFLLVGVYLVFFSLAMFEFSFNRAYQKYMGRHPLIYDRPEVAPVLNQILSPDETYYLGPFAFEEHFYMRSKLASKHWITIPAMDKSERIQTELLGDLEENMPRLILIDHSHFIFGGKPGEFLEPFLAKNYTLLGQLHDEGIVEIIGTTIGPYNLFTDWYLSNQSLETTLTDLSQQDLITLP